MNSPFMVALGIRKLSPPALARVLGCFGYGSRCEDRVCRVFSRGTITLVQYAAYFSGFAPLFAERSFAGGYHSILITLVRVTLHFYSFLRYVVALSCFEGIMMEFEDTANGLLSLACIVQDIGVDIPLGDHCECQPTHSTDCLLLTSNPHILAWCFGLCDLCTEAKRAT
jgi:hypothetical protein